MQKNHLNIIAGIGVIIALISIFTVAYRLVRNPMSSVTSPKATHTVLIVDLNANGEFTESDLAMGKDAILAIRPVNMKNNNYEWFSSFDLLSSFDENRDKKLDAKDPIFPHLGLLFHPGDKTRQHFIPLKEAGIITIKLDKQLLTNAQAVSKKTKPEIRAGYVIMKGGGKREIRIIQVNI